MAAAGTARFDDYFDYLELHAEEFEEPFNTLLINATGFFRDPQAWEYKSTEIVPQLLAARAYAPSPPMLRSGSIRPRPPARA
jgi:two-component system CheB/CheR fusion protein